MILLLDNFDSFVHNLARYVRLTGHVTRVIRTDAVSADQVASLHPHAIVISPGPCDPSSAGCSVDVVKRLVGQVPILGVCLGHQVIAHALGGQVEVGVPVHGTASEIEHDGQGIFEGLPNPQRVGRYHSLCVRDNSLPRRLRVTARSSDGVVMGIADPECCLFGVQFHPESLLTDHGLRMIQNFVAAATRFQSDVMATSYARWGMTPRDVLPCWSLPEKMRTSK